MKLILKSILLITLLITFQHTVLAEDNINNISRAANTLFIEGQYNEAIDMFSKLIELSPDDPSPSYITSVAP